MKTALLALLLLVGCAEDVSTTVNLAPSAEAHAEQAARVVDALNAALGSEVFTLQAIGQESRVDDQVVVRKVDSLGDRVRGLCSRTHAGVIVRVVDATTDVELAHELGHAAGLHHVSDPANLMHPKATRLGLSDDQVAQLLRAP